MPRLENTLQQERSLLSAVLPTGLLSTRAVEAYRLNPNRLKSLASQGQGYLFASRPPANSLHRIDQSTATGLRLPRVVDGTAGAQTVESEQRSAGTHGRLKRTLS